MRKTLLCLLLIAAAMVQARTWTPAQVKDVIRKVNTYWQQNNKAEVRSFWDNAAYHTGNMEVYKLLNDQQMLFGDWQICFQTYIDLYNMQKDEKRVARAKEVMGYEAGTAIVLPPYSFRAIEL